MDDSSLFMEWAMDTLQHENPLADDAYHRGGDVLIPSLHELCSSASQNGTAAALAAETAALQDARRHRATNSWSSGDTDSAGGVGGGNAPDAVVAHDGWSSNSAKCAPSSSSVGSTNYRSVSWNFTSALAQPSNEAAGKPSTVSWNPEDGRGGGVPEPVYGSLPSRRSVSAKSAGASTAGHTSPAAPYPQDHIMAERQRREKINRRFIELSTVIPGLKKMDKATILGDAVRYVKEQQEKLKALEGSNGRSSAATIESVVLVKKPFIAGATLEDDDGCCRSPPSAAADATTRSSLPEIEARISESTVMVRVHCENGKGVLVRLLAEVEGLHLSITHTNAIPFPACTVIITVIAKVQEGYNITAEDIVGRLNSALHQRLCRNSTREATTEAINNQGHV